MNGGDFDGLGGLSPETEDVLRRAREGARMPTPHKRRLKVAVLARIVFASATLGAAPTAVSAMAVATKVVVGLAIVGTLGAGSYVALRPARHHEPAITQSEAGRMFMPMLIGHRFPGEVLGGVLPLAVFEVGRLHEDSRAVRPGAFAMSVGVVHAHHHRVRDLTGPRGPTLIADVADDRRNIRPHIFTRRSRP